MHALISESSAMAPRRQMQLYGAISAVAILLTLIVGAFHTLLAGFALTGVLLLASGLLRTKYCDTLIGVPSSVNDKVYAVKRSHVSDSIRIIGRGLVIGSLLVLLLKILILIMSCCLQNAFTLMSFGCLFAALFVLLIEPAINGFIRLYLWKFVGEHAQIQINWISGTVYLRSIDIAMALLPSVGVLQPTKAVFSLVEISLHPFTLFEGLQMNVDGVLIEMDYHDPVVMGSERIAPDVMTAEAVKIMRDEENLHAFEAKRDKMIAACNTTTKLIRSKLKALSAECANVHEELSGHQASVLLGITPPSPHVSKNGNNLNSNAAHREHSVVNKSKGTPPKNVQAQIPWWTSKIDAIISTFEVSVLNVSVTLNKVPGEMDNSYSHEQVTISLQVPEFSLRSTEIAVGPDATKPLLFNSSKIPSRGENGLSTQIKHKVGIVLGPLEVLNWEDVHARGAKHRQTILQQLDLRMNFTAPPLYSGIMMAPDAAASSSIKAEFLLNKVKLHLMPDTVRPLLRLSSGFSTLSKLHQIQERLGLQLAHDAGHWSPEDREIYIKLYAWICAYDESGIIGPLESNVSINKDTDDRNGSCTTLAHPDKVRTVLRALEKRASSEEELLDARHIALKWDIPAAKENLLKHTSSKLQRQADRGAFLTNNLDFYKEKYARSRFPSLSEDAILKSLSQKPLFLGKIEIVFRWDLLVACMGTNPSPNVRFKFEMRNINLQSTISVPEIEQDKETFRKDIDMALNVNSIECIDEVAKKAGRIHTILNCDSTDEVINDIAVKFCMVPSGALSATLDIMPIRLVVWFDRINELIAMLGNISVPDYEEKAKISACRHLEVGKMLWQFGTDDNSSIRPINDATTYAQAMLLAYEQENTGMLIGSSPKLDLDAKFGIRIAIPQSEALESTSIAALKFMLDVESRIHSNKLRESFHFDLLNFQIENSTLSGDSINGETVVDNSCMNLLEIENEAVDIQLIYRADHDPKKTLLTSHIDLMVGKLAANITPAVISSLYRISSSYSDANERADAQAKEMGHFAEYHKDSLEKLRIAEQLSKLEASFKRIDVSGDGELDCDEFVEFLHKQEKHTSEKHNIATSLSRAMPFELRLISKRLVSLIDKDKNGTVSWDEFKNCPQIRASIEGWNSNSLNGNDVDFEDNSVMLEPNVSMFGAEYCQCKILSPKLQEEIHEQYSKTSQHFLVKAVKGKISKAANVIGKNVKGTIDVVADVGKNVASNATRAVGKSFDTVINTLNKTKPPQNMRRHQEESSVSNQNRAPNAHETCYLLYRLKKLSVESCSRDKGKNSEALSGSHTSDSIDDTFEPEDINESTFGESHEKLLWDVIGHEMGIHKKSGWEDSRVGGLLVGKNLIVGLQKRLVRLLNDFDLAEVVWGYCIEPCIESIPHSGKVWQIDRSMYMDNPTSIEEALFRKDRHDTPSSANPSPSLAPLSTKMSASGKLAGIAIRLIDPLDADAGPDIEVSLGLTSLDYIMDDESFMSSEHIQLTLGANEGKTAIDYGCKSKEDSNSPITLQPNWRLRFSSNLRITYLNIESNACIEPLLENTKIAVTFPSTAPSWREQRECMQKGMKIDRVHTNSTSRIPPVKTATLNHIKFNEKSYVTQSLNDADFVPVHQSAFDDRALAIAVSAVRVNLTVKAMTLITRWKVNNDQALLDVSKETEKKKNLNHERIQKSQVVSVQVENLLGVDAFVYIGEGYDAIEGALSDSDIAPYTGTNGSHTAHLVQSRDKARSGSYESFVTESAYSTGGESKANSMIWTPTVSTSTSTRKRARTVSSTQSENIYVERASCQTDELLGKENFSSKVKKAQQIHKSNTVNEYLRALCTRNQKICSGDKAEIPVDTRTGISDRYRNILDQTELRNIFDAADSDNSNFLELDEVTSLLARELKQHYSCGDDRVLDQINDYMLNYIDRQIKESGDVKINFNEFVDICDAVRKKLRVEDALYVNISGFYDIDMINSQRGKDAFLIPINQNNFHKAMTLVVDMSSKARGKATLRSNVSVIVNTYMDIKCYSAEGDITLMTWLNLPTDSNRNLREDGINVTTEEREKGYNTDKTVKITYISVALGQKVFLPLGTCRFQLKDHYDTDDKSKWSENIHVWFETFEPNRSPTNCMVTLNEGALTVQRSHKLLPVATDFARRHGTQSAQRMPDTHTRDRWRAVNYTYDFVYTVTAMSTVVNLVPFNIDVEIITIDKNAVENLGGNGEVKTGIRNGNHFEIVNNTKNISPATSRIVATPLEQDSEIEIKVRPSLGDDTPFSEVAKFSMGQFKGKTLFRTIKGRENSNYGNLTVKMSTLPVQPKQNGFWPGDRVTVGLRGEKGTGIKRDEIGGKEYEVVSREYKDEFGNTIVILRSLEEASISDVGSFDGHGSDAHGSQVADFQNRKYVKRKGRRESRVSVVLDKIGKIGQGESKNSLGKGVHKVDTLERQIYPIFTPTYMFEISVSYWILNHTGLSLEYSFSNDSHGRNATQISDLDESWHLGAHAPVHAVVDFESSASLQAQLREKTLNPLGPFKPNYRVALFEPLNAAGQKSAPDRECQLSLHFKARDFELKNLLSRNKEEKSTKNRSYISKNDTTNLLFAEGSQTRAEFRRTTRENISIVGFDHLLELEDKGMIGSVLCTIRSMNGKSDSKLINTKLIQLEAPVIIENTLDVEVYFRFSPEKDARIDVSKHNGEHLSAELNLKKGIWILIEPGQQGKAFCSPESEPVLELGIFNPSTGMFKWGKPMDLRLKSILGSGGKTMRQYTDQLIVETETVRTMDTAASGKGRYITLREGIKTYRIENRSTTLPIHCCEVDDYVRDVENIGSRHRLHATKTGNVLYPMCTQSFALSPRAPMILNIGIHGLNNSTISVNVEETGFSHPIFVKVSKRVADAFLATDELDNCDIESLLLGRSESTTLNNDNGTVWFRLNVEIYTDGIHNVISVSDSIDRIPDLLVANAQHSSMIRPISPASAKLDHIEDLPSDQSNSVNLYDRTAVQIGSITLSLFDMSPREVLSLTLDEITSEWDDVISVFSLQHIQLDDMTEGTQTPIVLEPVNTGFNSCRNEAWRLQCRDQRLANIERNTSVHTKMRPWLSVVGHKAPSTGIHIYDACSLDIGDLNINFDLKFVLVDVMAYVQEFLPNLFDMLGYPTLPDLETELERILWASYPYPGFSGSYGLTSSKFFRKVKINDCDLRFHLATDALMATRNDQIDSFSDSVKGILKLLGPSVQMAPVVRLGTQYMNHINSNWVGLVENWIEQSLRDLRSQVFGALRGVASMKIFGDVGGYADNVVSTARTAIALSQNRRMPRAVGRVFQSFFGGAFLCMGSTAEVFLEQLMAVSGQEVHYTSAPRHVFHGLSQGGYSFGRALVNGTTGLILRPYERVREGGIRKFFKGFGEGVAGVVLMIPLAYVGFYERFYKGVGATFQAAGKVSITGTRRPPRHLKTLENIQTENEFKRGKRIQDGEDGNHDINDANEKLMDIDDSPIAVHTTIRVHRADCLKLRRNRPSSSMKIYIKCNLYMRKNNTLNNLQKERMLLAERSAMTVTRRNTYTSGSSLTQGSLTDKCYKGDEISDSSGSTEYSGGGLNPQISMKKGKRGSKKGQQWVKVQQYRSSDAPHVVDPSFKGEEFRFNLDKLCLKSDELSKGFVCGTHSREFKISLRVYEIGKGPFGHIRKCRIAQRDLFMNDIFRYLPSRDPQPFSARIDNSAGATPNSAWNLIKPGNILVGDERENISEKLSEMSRKKSLLNMTKFTLNDVKYVKDASEGSNQARKSFHAGIDQVSQHPSRDFSLELKRRNMVPAGRRKVETEVLKQNDFSAVDTTYTSIRSGLSSEPSERYLDRRAMQKGRRSVGMRIIAGQKVSASGIDEEVKQNDPQYSSFNCSEIHWIDLDPINRKDKGKGDAKEIAPKPVTSLPRLQISGYCKSNKFVIGLDCINISLHIYICDLSVALFFIYI